MHTYIHVSIEQAIIQKLWTCGNIVDAFTKYVCDIKQLLGVAEQKLGMIAGILTIKLWKMGMSKTC